MKARAFEKELLDLERRFFQCMKDNDVDEALRLSADPCIVTGPQGVARIDHKAFRKMMDGAAWKLHDFEFANAKVERLGDNAAVVAYTIREDLTVDGKRMTLEANDSSTWVRRDGEWVCVLHTEALAGDPFGRDKAKPERAARPKQAAAKKSAAKKSAAKKSAAKKSAAKATANGTRNPKAARKSAPKKRAA